MVDSLIDSKLNKFPFDGLSIHFDSFSTINSQSIICDFFMFRRLTAAVARLTRFEGRGHKKVPKGPPFAYVI